jgi:hypothetical protein
VSRIHWVAPGTGTLKIVVYYETMNRTNEEIYTTLTHWVGRGTGRPKDKDEVNKQEVCECEG